MGPSCPRTWVRGCGWGESTRLRRYRSGFFRTDAAEEQEKAWAIDCRTLRLFKSTAIKRFREEKGERGVSERFVPLYEAVAVCRCVRRCFVVAAPRTVAPLVWRRPVKRGGLPILRKDMSRRRASDCSVMPDLCRVRSRRREASEAEAR